MKFGVLLSGCGVYDGSEIHESVLTILAINKRGFSAEFIAPDVEQHHVINHLDGNEIAGSRNVRIESARIARGPVSTPEPHLVSKIDALVMPGGFGAAKNWTKWAFDGPEGAILPEVQSFIQSVHKAKKPIGALCMSPTTIARALRGVANATLTVGTTSAESPYDIAAISAGIESMGNSAAMAGVEEMVVDETNLLATTPCYMMNASISQIQIGIEKVIDQLVAWVR